MVKNLGNISCPHVHVSEGKTYVYYSKDGCIIRLDMDSGVRKKLCFGDEYVPVGNGKFLLRTGQSYVQTEEIQ